MGAAWRAPSDRTIGRARRTRAFREDGHDVSRDHQRQRGAKSMPRVRTITPRDLIDALSKGIDDFAAMPTHAIFLCLIYPVAGLVIAGAAFGYNLLSLIYPHGDRLRAGRPVRGDRPLRTQPPTRAGTRNRLEPRLRSAAGRIRSARSRRSGSSCSRSSRSGSAWRRRSIGPISAICRAGVDGRIRRNRC